MRALYSFIFYLLIPVILARLCLLARRNPDYKKRWAERFGFVEKIRTDKKIIWVHAVSVGEVQAARPLVDSLLKTYPGFEILITTMTPTGACSVQKSFGKAVRHFYIPYDLPISVKRFIAATEPAILIVMETELWPNLFHYCYANDIPVILVNARMSEKSFRAYKRLFLSTKTMLSKVSLIIAQGPEHARRLTLLGADQEKVMVTGNLKFDAHIPDSLIEKARDLKNGLAARRPVWIAASTHHGEDEIILDVFRRILHSQSDCLLIIVPRHPERVAAIKDLCRSKNFNFFCKSDVRKLNSSVQILIVDTLGELPLYYAIADIAFVGGSFVEVGGHNMLEPASLGVPVIMGPHVFNFQEISQLLLDKEAAYQVFNANELLTKLSSLLENKSLRRMMGNRGRDIVLQNSGNVTNVIELVNKFM